MKPTPLEEERINKLEKEFNVTKHNMDVKDIMIMIYALIIIVALIGINIWMWLA